MFGSATIFTTVLLLPIPVRDNRAATLMLAGNRETASFAVPSKIVVAEVIESRLTLEFSKNFAPLRESGCFVVVSDDESISSLIDLIPSSPAIAPDGKIILF